MTQAQILLDTTSYLRLAQNVRPLLNVEFGDDKYCLYIIKELEEEFNKNTRLKSKFGWFHSKEYKANRSKPIQLPKEKRSAFDRELSIVAGIASSDVSLIDCKVLTHGLILEIPVITDDEKMSFLGKETGIKCWSTLHLMKLMLENGHIDSNKIDQIVLQWQYLPDIPKNFRADFKEYFGRQVPKLKLE